MSATDPAAPPGGARGGTDRVVAGVILAFTVLVYALTYRFDEVPAALMSGLGAEFFPRLVLGVLGLLAVLMMLHLGITPMARPAPVVPTVWFTGAAMVAFMGAIELIGMWPASLLFLVGLGRLWGERSLWKLAASALGFCGVLYLLFVRVLGGSFPKGMLGALWS